MVGGQTLLALEERQHRKGKHDEDCNDRENEEIGHDLHRSGPLRPNHDLAEDDDGYQQYEGDDPGGEHALMPLVDFDEDAHDQDQHNEDVEGGEDDES